MFFKGKATAEQILQIIRARIIRMQEQIRRQDLTPLEKEELADMIARWRLRLAEFVYGDLL